MARDRLANVGQPPQGLAQLQLHSSVCPSQAPCPTLGAGSTCPARASTPTRWQPPDSMRYVLPSGVADVSVAAPEHGCTLYNVSMAATEPGCTPCLHI